MKRIIYKVLIVSIMILINISVSAQTYYLNTPTGTFSVTDTAYLGIKTIIWNINIGSQKPVKLDYEVDIVNNSDFVDVYAVTAGGNEYLMLTVTGTEAGSISTILPTGKAKVRFRINSSWGGNYYDGLTASFSEDNIISNTSVSDNAYVNQNMSVLGNAGIGTASTSSNRLSVSGTNQYGIYSVNSSTNRTAYGIYSRASSSGQAAYIYGLYSSVSGTASNKWAGYFTGGDVEVSGGNLKVSGNTTINGNVGIGKTTPQYKLDVGGIIRANEIIVNTTGADFVFDENYKLKPLGELHTFIKENKHLPDIAPASVMQEDGLSISEMNVKLLQKVEELTLYLIQQEDKLQKQETAIKELKSKINEMERR